jgi:hypothetical protein
MCCPDCYMCRFRQSVSADYLGENHKTRNRLLYPQVTAQLRTSGSSISRNVYVRAVISGFLLDLDATIPDYVFSLIDVYREGKARVGRLSAIQVVARDAPNAAAERHPSWESDHTDSLESDFTKLPTSNIFASLTFLSGQIQALSSDDPTPNNSNINLQNQDTSNSRPVFKLPEVSVWAEYRAAPALHKISDDNLVAGPSILMFKSTVHSSQNTLRPELLPFITELVGHVETRLRTVHALPASPEPSLPPEIPHPNTEASTQTQAQSEPMSSMQISFSLRIDQSKLELTCQPDVNVVAGLHWESGGFIVNISPGARNVTFSGTVAGLTVGLKHGFLSDDCVHLDARNLTFNLTFTKAILEAGKPPNNFVSLVVDTEFSGGVKFSRLQDILCFKAVWLDRIPVLNQQSDLSPAVPQKQKKAQNETGDVAGFTTLILLRIRQVKLEIDLGQSISTVVLNLKDTILDTKITEAMNDVSLLIGDVGVAGTGNVAGRMNVANCAFHTIRRSREFIANHAESRNNSMLELRLTSDALTAVLESDHQQLMLYR